MSTPQIPAPWEEQLAVAARDLAYPPTPRIAETVHSRLEAQRRPSARWRLRPVWVVVVVLTILASLLAVPSVRAQIVDFIQLGVVRIFPAPPTATPTPTRVPTRPGAAAGASTPTNSGIAAGVSTPTSSGTSPFQAPITATPAAIAVTPTDLPAVSLPPLAGETTLSDARGRLPFPILLPDFPAGIGLPQHVYIQPSFDNRLILVWLDPNQPRQARMSLEEIASGSLYIDKIMPPVIQQTRVKHLPALWTEGPYLLEMDSGISMETYLVTGHVLVWVENDITYRLETALSLEETIKIAESLK